MAASKPIPAEVRAGLAALWTGSEQDANKVWHTVLEEMLILYYPPFRAGTDEELLEQATVGLRAYVEDLAEFSVETLQMGWRDVRRVHRVERWPTIQSIRDACLQLPSSRMSGGSVQMLSQSAEDRWRERWDRDPKLVPEAMRKLLNLG